MRVVLLVLINGRSSNNASGNNSSTAGPRWANRWFKDTVLFTEEKSVVDPSVRRMEFTTKNISGSGMLDAHER